MIENHSMEGGIKYICSKRIEREINTYMYMQLIKLFLVPKWSSCLWYKVHVHLLLAINMFFFNSIQCIFFIYLQQPQFLQYKCYTQHYNYLQIYEFTAMCITYYTTTSKYYRAVQDAGEWQDCYYPYTRGVFSLIEILF